MLTNDNQYKTCTSILFIDRIISYYLHIICYIVIITTAVEWVEGVSGRRWGKGGATGVRGDTGDVTNTVPTTGRLHVLTSAVEGVFR